MKISAELRLKSRKHIKSDQLLNSRMFRTTSIMYRLSKQSRFDMHTCRFDMVNERLNRVLAGRPTLSLGDGALKVAGRIEHSVPVGSDGGHSVRKLRQLWNKQDEVKWVASVTRDCWFSCSSHHNWGSHPARHTKQPGTTGAS